MSIEGGFTPYKFTFSKNNDNIAIRGGVCILVITLEHVEILDEADELVKMIIGSDVMQAYQNANKALENNEEAQNLIKRFVHIKEDYEDVRRFGTYHPDYNEIMKNVRKVKRNMDMNPFVAQFKVAERELQRFLDEISEYIAKSASDNIMVPKDGLSATDGGCASGSCGSGGACGCKAS